MLKNKVSSQVVNYESYGLNFDYGNGGGFTFDCNGIGEIIKCGEPEMNYGAWYNMHTAVNDAIDGKCSMEIVDYSHKYREPAHGECEECGCMVYLVSDYGHGIDCDGCSAIYNMSGQRLADRSQWEDRYEDDDSVGYNVRFNYVGSDY